MSGIILSVLGAVGPKAGTYAGKLVLDVYLSKEDAQHWKETLFGDTSRTTEAIERIEKALSDISVVLDETQKLTLFKSYNDITRAFRVLCEKFRDGHAPTATDASRQNSNISVLDNDKGVIEQLRLMKDVLFGREAPFDQSLVAQYSNMLIRNKVSAHEYCQRMDTLIGQLTIMLTVGMLMRQHALNEGGVAKDVELSQATFAETYSFFYTLTAPRRELVRLFDRLNDEGTPFSLRRCFDHRFLTGLSEGKPVSKRAPFSMRDGSKFPGRGDTDEHPQVFVCGIPLGNSEEIGWPTPSERAPTIVLQRDHQLWVARTRKKPDGITTVALKHKPSGLFLASRGSEFVCLADEADPGTDWKVIADKPDLKASGGALAFILENVATGKPLDTVSSRAAPGKEVAYGDGDIKWRVADAAVMRCFSVAGLPDQRPVFGVPTDFKDGDKETSIWLDGDALYLGMIGHVAKFDAASGKQLKLVRLEDAYQRVEVGKGGGLLYAAALDKLHALDPDSLDTRWTATDKDFKQRWKMPLLVLNSGHIVANNGFIRNFVNGQKMSGNDLPGLGSGFATLHYSNQLIYVGIKGTLVVLNTSLLQVARLQIVEEEDQVMNVLTDGERLFVGVNGEAMRIHDMKVAARNDLPGTGRGEVRLASDGTRLYVGTRGYVWALKPDDMSKLWSVDLPKASRDVTSVLVKDNRAYVGCNGMIYVLDAATGTVLMRESLGAVNSPVSLVLGPDGVYAAMAGTVAVIPFSIGTAASVQG